MLQDQEQRARLVAGVVIILLGVVALLNNFVSGDLLAWLWIVVLAGSAVAFGWVYSRERTAWAAIGTYVTGFLAAFVFLLTQVNLSGVWVPVLVLLAIALPFVYLWWQDRRQWGLLVPAYVLVAVAVFLLLTEMGVSGTLVPTFVLLAVALPFVVGWLRDRQQWGLLVPAYVMVTVAVVVLLGGSGASAELIPVFVMWAIALPFLLAAALTRQWPLLIPGGIMGLIGLFLLVGVQGAASQVVGTLVALGLIGVGLLMLFRREPQKAKRQDEDQ